jgi:hypothetical protein
MENARFVSRLVDPMFVCSFLFFFFFFLLFFLFFISIYFFFFLPSFALGWRHPEWEAIVRGGEKGELGVRNDGE